MTAWLSASADGQASCMGLPGLLTLSTWNPDSRVGCGCHRAQAARAGVGSARCIARKPRSAPGKDLPGCREVLVRPRKSASAPSGGARPPPPNHHLLVRTLISVNAHDLPDSREVLVRPQKRRSWSSGCTYLPPPMHICALSMCVSAPAHAQLKDSRNAPASPGKDLPGAPEVRFCPRQRPSVSAGSSSRQSPMTFRAARTCISVPAEHLPDCQHSDVCPRKRASRRPAQ